MTLSDEPNNLLPPLYKESVDNPFFPRESDMIQPRKTLSPAPPKPGGLFNSALETSLGGERINSPASLRMSWDPGPIQSGSTPEYGKGRSRIPNTRHSYGGDLGMQKLNGKSNVLGHLESESTDNESLNHPPSFNLKSRKPNPNMRAVSVYSPSSFESSEINASRPPRYVPRRRASVPAIGLATLPDRQVSDSLRSPEFSKAFRELNGRVSPQGSNALSRYA